MSRPMIRLLILIVSLAVLSGCWDVRDINKRFLPVVMGIDKKENGSYKIIFQVPTTKGETHILEGEARTISKAVDLVRTNAEKSVDLMHLRLFLISQHTAEGGIKEIIDYAVGSNEISVKSMVAIVSGDFEKTLYHEIKPTPEVSSYDYFSEEAGWTPNVSINRLWEAYRSAHSYTEDFVIPLLEAGTDTLFTFRGSAIMSRDRMVGTLSRDETLLNNIFREKYTGGTIEISKYASVEIKKATLRSRTQWPASGPKLTSNLHLDVLIVENKEEQTNDEVAKDIEKLLEDRSITLFKKIRLLKADILGNGQHFRPWMSEQQLKDWKNTWFPQSEQQVNITVNVRDNIDFKEKIK